MTVGLAVSYGALAIFFSPTQVLVLLWARPTIVGFNLTASLGIALLGFGRYRVLPQPAPFWMGLGYGYSAVLAVFWFLSLPELLAEGEVLDPLLLNASYWLAALLYTTVAIPSLIAAVADWPRRGAVGERRLPELVKAGAAILGVIGLLSTIFRPSLPGLVVEGTLTLLAAVWASVVALIVVAGAVFSLRRYRHTGDSLYGYLAIAQVTFIFTVLAFLFSRASFDGWFYVGLVTTTGGFLVVLFGLLFDYVGLYYRERDRTRDLQVLLDTTPVGIIFYSAPDGRPVLYNTTAETILGQPLNPEVGLEEQPAYYGIYGPGGEMLRPDELPASHALRGATRRGVDLLVRRPDAHDIHLLANSAPLRAGEGRVVGAVVALLDVTAVREQERLRDEFISAAAHELRTPVTAIKGYIQVLRRLSPGERQAREAQVFDAISTQSDRIDRRVQELLEVVRFRKAAPELRLARFDLSELVAEAVRRVQTTTLRHPIVLTRTEPVPVEADRDRIDEVLATLLDNAVKYSPAGGDVEVRVWAENGEALVSVKDYGVGIPKARQPHIFEPFFEPIPPGVPGYRGTVTLSLYLSKLILERHKGRIWLESEEGKGSTFYVALPLVKRVGDDQKRSGRPQVRHEDGPPLPG